MSDYSTYVSVIKLPHKIYAGIPTSIMNHHYNIAELFNIYIYIYIYNMIYTSVIITEYSYAIMDLQVREMHMAIMKILELRTIKRSIMHIINPNLDLSDQSFAFSSFLHIWNTGMYALVTPFCNHTYYGRCIPWL